MLEFQSTQFGPLKIFESPQALVCSGVPIRHHHRQRWDRRGTYHRRIFKKWIKRWGFRMDPTIYQTQFGLFVHPALMSQVQDEIHRASRVT